MCDNEARFASESQFETKSVISSHLWRNRMNPIRIGVVGCGAIAQVHHMPNLHDLPDLFQVNAVCDVSPGAAAFVAKKFHTPHPYSCYSLFEADAIIAARRRSGVVGQVGYMKVYDPAYEYAKREVDNMDNIRFVQVNHLHPNNDLHMRQFDIRRFNDAPASAIEATRAARLAARREAIGDAPAHVEGVFHLHAQPHLEQRYLVRWPCCHHEPGIPKRRALCRYMGGPAQSLGFQRDVGGLRR
jgi:hypothetical protein